MRAYRAAMPRGERLVLIIAVNAAETGREVGHTFSAHTSHRGLASCVVLLRRCLRAGVHARAICRVPSWLSRQLLTRSVP